MLSLTTEQVEVILKKTAASFPHDECLTCECFLGLVMQLKIDAEPGAQTLLAKYKIPHKEMHACLGCDPCPAGDRYAQHIRQHGTGKLITL